MVSRFKSVLLLFMAVFMTVCMQMQIADIESSLNAETSTDRNRDYDRDGETGDAQPVDELVKLPALILFYQAALVFLIFLLSQQRRVNIFTPLMKLKDYVTQILRPPAFS